ncbi:hypothetical protein [Halobellus litoreus]|uniref:PglZ domain-containing protein n=1 Tax=Halobellus litoreus TaxID=755310 RepID=A0ABD6DXS6_9EURY|nr:hypothetical protein [Halobellus litoreus]
MKEVIKKIKKGLRNPTEAYQFVRNRARTVRTHDAAKIYHDIVTGPERSIWDDKWDLLIILDACRPDVLTECASDFDFLPSDIPIRRSNAAQSLEFMNTNFVDKYSDQMSQTVYVTGNVYTSYDEVNTEAFAQLHEVWQTGWSDELGTIPPEPLTDRAITVGRRDAPKKLIVHYMQPHYPSIPVDLNTGIDIDQFGEGGSTDVFKRLKNGELTHEEAWYAYRENCRVVLDSVRTLISNYDADKAVITADHGNGFGESGVYRHPAGCQTAAVRMVPWVEITGVDHRNYYPAETVNHTNRNVEDRLESLGYK